MDSRPLVVDLMDAWAIHDCLQQALAGFSGRQENTEPWNGTALMTKLVPAILVLEQGTREYTLELTKGELECINFNVPRTVYEGAKAMLLRVFHALEEMAIDHPLLGSEPENPDQDLRYRTWKKDQRA